jgi:hypothetical protein
VAVAVVVVVVAVAVAKGGWTTWTPQVVAAGLGLVETFPISFSKNLELGPCVNFQLFLDARLIVDELHMARSCPAQQGLGYDGKKRT